jgi:hypothetical protein
VSGWTGGNLRIFINDNNFIVTASNGQLTAYIFSQSSSGVGLLFRADGSAFTGTIDNVSVQTVQPMRIAERAHSSGARVQLGLTPAGFLTATAFDGTTTRTVTTTAAYNTATWLKAEADYTTDGSLSISVNGQEVAVTRGNPLLPLYGRKNLYNFSNDFSVSTWFTDNGATKAVLNVADPFGGTKAVELNFTSIFVCSLNMSLCI